ncbi:MAG: hypothetical protein C4581_13930 [Nitrospiraceae bacterium]|nr:MAG: hypothetical protein C4581_13930 [Nitrospiraceae bacterium]
MSNILLLYDTQEEDLARDYKDYLAELDIEMRMIPLSYDKGKTLQDKEERYFDSAAGAIFLLTPRTGNASSSSVAHEMGQAKQKFQDTPEKVIYLKDKNCTVPTIDQKPYISFDRGDIRSIIKANTSLLKNLKQAEWLSKKQVEQKETQIDIANLSESVDSVLKKICVYIGSKPKGVIAESEFDALLKTKYYLNPLDINLTRKKLENERLLIYCPFIQSDSRKLTWGFQLTEVGWKLVEYEVERDKKKRASKPSLGLMDYEPAVSRIPAISNNYKLGLGLIPGENKRRNDKT